MKVTKYEHACLVVVANQKLIIDPGIFSASCTDFDDVVAVIVTHVHPDHFDPEKLKQITNQNPGVQIFTVQSVADELKVALPVTIVSDGQELTAGPFKLEFFGTDHAQIHESIPLTRNTGVLVNNQLYYPGDSLTVPHKPVEVLAVPSEAPWLKTSEAMDLITAIKPKQVFPVHNVFLSEAGNNLHNNLLKGAAEKVEATFVFLLPSESINIEP